MSIDFPVSLKYSRLDHASNVLLHIRQRSDLNVAHIGEKIQPVLAAYRSVLPEFLDNFYELLYALIVQLNKYCDLAESCSKSGRYQDQRQEALNNLLSTLVRLEADQEIMVMLKAMLRQ